MTDKMSIEEVRIAITKETTATENGCLMVKDGWLNQVISQYTNCFLDDAEDERGDKTTIWCIIPYKDGNLDLFAIRYENQSGFDSIEVQETV